MKLKLQRALHRMPRYLLYGFYFQMMFISLVAANGNNLTSKSKEGLAKEAVFMSNDLSRKEVATQKVTITGKVSDENGEPIPGATVTVQGTTLGTATDLDGNYSLEVEEGATLSFSFIGYETVTVDVANQTTIDVTLKENISSLNEVVVIGYGTQKKGDVTGSVASVKSENFVKAPVKDVGQLLQGKIAGLTIGSTSGDPTSGVQVSLRGNTTINGASTSPLILIDGVPGDFRTVAPEDIESIDVLKDGSAAAIYGIRGNNGVILITTKGFDKNQINSVDYSVQMSTDQVYRKLDMLTAADYRHFK